MPDLLQCSNRSKSGTGAAEAIPANSNPDLRAIAMTVSERRVMPIRRFSHAATGYACAKAFAGGSYAETAGKLGLMRTLMLLSLAVSSVFAAPNFTGAWKLNLQKSA